VPGAVPLPEPSRAKEDSVLASEVKQLRAQLQQRDNEIAILVNMVKQAGSTGRPALASPPSSASSLASTDGMPSVSTIGRASAPLSVPASTAPSSVGSMLAAGDVVDPSILADREKAMDVFMASYPIAQVRCFISLCTFERVL
jgi:hypothetical protein